MPLMSSHSPCRSFWRQPGLRIPCLMFTCSARYLALCSAPGGLWPSSTREMGSTGWGQRLATQLGLPQTSIPGTRPPRWPGASVHQSTTWSSQSWSSQSLGVPHFLPEPGATSDTSEPERATPRQGSTKTPCTRQEVESPGSGQGLPSTSTGCASVSRSIKWGW